jgi:membrane carboxypeptidase/penicillin-binding protein
MGTALEGVPESDLLQPDNVVAVKISPDTGRAIPDDKAGGMTEYFKVGTAPGVGGSGDGTTPAYSDRGSTGGGGTTEGLF